MDMDKLFNIHLSMITLPIVSLSRQKLSYYSFHLFANFLFTLFIGALWNSISSPSYFSADLFQLTIQASRLLRASNMQTIVHPINH